MARVMLMKSYSEAMYWKTDRNWYAVNEELDRYELTRLAPPRAIDRFRLYLRENNLPEDPLPIKNHRSETTTA